MEYSEQDIPGVYIFQLNQFSDKRGKLNKYFYSTLFNQFNFSVDDIYTTTSHKGVVRGLHHQTGNFGQSKLITCLAGSFWDVSIDLRQGSETYGQQFEHYLSCNNGQALLLPAGFSHGTVSLEEGTVMLSICSGAYLPEYESGININSTDLSFLEPSMLNNLIISSKDQDLSNLKCILEET
jgi:dTDP-4-dehydrorhamnose 3,5-epimerase